MKNSNQLRDLIQLLPYKEVQKLIDKWQVDKNVRTLPTRKLIYICVASQIFHFETCREIGKIFSVPKSTLADAMMRRSHGFFEELCSLIVGKILAHEKGSLGSK